MGRGVPRVHVPLDWALNCTFSLLQGDEGDGGLLEEMWHKKHTYLNDFFFPKKGFRACGLVGIQLKGDASKQVSKQIFP